MLIVAYPLYFIIIASISDPIKVNTGAVWILPGGFNLEGYKRIFEHKDILRGYWNSIIYTVVGTALNLALTLTSGYALSRKDLYGRNVMMGLMAFTMFFSGGIIPLFLLINSLKLYDSFWAMILPTAVSVWNVIIVRTFYQSTLPEDLLDAARIDGCDDFRFLFSIVLPLSSAITAVMLIFYAVGHWNAFFNALIFLRRRELYPLQLILRDILLANQMGLDMSNLDANSTQSQMLAESIKYGVIIVASLPVMIIYPWVQKHYVQGVMIGAIKG
jgi:putative aldouronate transport system permease protein